MKRLCLWTMVMTLGLAGLGACAFRTSRVSTTAASMPSVQAAQGRAMFTEHCASCHGSSGEGGAKAPRVVGSNALPIVSSRGVKGRTYPFHTAADVLAWVRQNMPGDKPGSLNDTEYSAIVAFILDANRVKLTQPIDENSAAGVILHP